jgi:hypothetical protein
VYKKLKVIVYGTGSFCETMLKRLKKIDIVAFSDSDCNKHNTLFHNKIVIRPEDIVKYEYDKIIIASTFFEEISKHLIELGINKEYIVDYMQIVKEEIINFYNDNLNLTKNDLELQEVLNYLNKDENRLQVFCYEFTDKYINRNIDVFKDENNGLYYVLFNQKKMYFKRSMDTIQKVIKYYNFICAEQDIRSPHRYLTEEFDVDNDSVVVDIGVAEGNFALSVIDKVKKIYLFEVDEEWIEALNETFRPYLEKVCIVNAFVSNIDGKGKTTLDNYMFGEKIDFVKMDVEGEERFVLEGAKKHLSQNNLKLLLCVYHKADDTYILSEYLKEVDFNVEFSKGYMFFDLDNESYTYPFFRKGVLRSKK